MEIKLPAHLEEYVLERVKSGDYRSVDDVFAAALVRLQVAEDSLSPEDLQAIEEAEAEIAAGKGIDFHQFVAELRKKASA